MVRLIDADALREEIEFHVTSVSVCATAAEARGQTNFKMRCLKDIDNAPTVDAIPVEWLGKFCADDIAEDQRETIEWMLKVWKREQEAR